MLACDSLISFRAASGTQSVEMYQCYESCTESKTKNSMGQNVKTRTCTHRMQWSSSWVNSGDFVKTPGSACPGFAEAGGNPGFPENLEPGSTTDYAQTLQTAQLAPAGSKAKFVPGYTLNHDLVKQLTPGMPVSLLPFAKNFTGTASNAKPWTRPLQVGRTNLRVSGSYLVTCPGPVQLGCVRIQYLKSGATSPSVIGQVTQAGQVTKAKMPGGWGCSSSTWQAIRAEKMTKKDMVSQLKVENKMLVWILRGCGILIAIMAVACCLQPIAAAADVLGDLVNFCPCGGFLENLLEGLVSEIICAVSCGVGCGASLFVIAIVWVFMRPLWGIGMLVVGCCCCGGSLAIKQMFKKEKPKGKGEDDSEDSALE